LSCYLAGKVFVLAFSGRIGGIVLSFSGLIALTIVFERNDNRGGLLASSQPAPRNGECAVHTRSLPSRVRCVLAPSTTRKTAFESPCLNAEASTPLVQSVASIYLSSCLAGNHDLSTYLAGLTKHIRGTRLIVLVFSGTTAAVSTHFLCGVLLRK
jgi:hypothetical protein